MKNELFYYLRRAGIFKDNSRYSYDGLSRILASEKTEQKRAERNRLKGIPYTKKEWESIQKKLEQRKIDPRKNNIKDVSLINN